MKAGIFPESKLAHKYCTGRGLEIGGSAHNSFGLDTLNVDYTNDMNTVFKQAEEKMCGQKMKVDIVSNGDEIPVENESYDFIISSHTIEHIFDPIKALKEWHRIIKKGGCIFTIIPITSCVPGENRPTTTITELIDRHEGRITEGEILKKVVTDQGGVLGTAIIEGILYDTKHGHWTVFDIDLFKEICSYLNYNIIEIQSPDDKVGNGFTVVIRKEAEMKVNVNFGVLVNDTLRLDMVLKRSQINGTVNFVQNAESATKGLNILLDKAEQEGADICVLLHQDVYLRLGWIDQVRYQIKMLPDSWVVCGVIGKDSDGVMCGKFHDMRIPDHFDTSDIHSFPHEACCFDEAVIIVNMKKKFRFDETLTGFDLYGTLCVLQAWESNQTAWVIDAFCEHYCTRSFLWSPPEQFCKNYKMLHDRFREKWKLDSTALGLSPNAEERLEQIRKFMSSAAPFTEEVAA